jgi:hypothetical protein
VGEPSRAIYRLCCQQEEMGEGEEGLWAAHLPKALTEKTAGQCHIFLSLVARKPPSGTLLCTCRGIQDKQGKLEGWDRGGLWAEVG